MPPAMAVHSGVTSTEKLQLEIDVPRAVDRGTPVPITLTVRNSSERQMDLYVTGRPLAFDLEITGADGATVWRRLKDQIVSQVLQIIELPSGATLELTDEWLQQTNRGVTVEAGRYTVVGELQLDGGTRSLTSVPMTFEIVAHKP